MAFGTAILIVSRRAGRSSGYVSRFAQWWGRLSYEVYLSHLLVLAGLRIVWPPDVMQGNATLILLGVFLVFSALAGWAWSRFYAEPVNRFARVRAAVA